MAEESEYQLQILSGGESDVGVTLPPGIDWPLYSSELSAYLDGFQGYLDALEESGELPEYGDLYSQNKELKANVEWLTFYSEMSKEASLYETRLAVATAIYEMEEGAAAEAAFMTGISIVPGLGTVAGAASTTYHGIKAEIYDYDIDKIRRDRGKFYENKETEGWELLEKNEREIWGEEQRDVKYSEEQIRSLGGGTSPPESYKKKTKEDDDGSSYLYGPQFEMLRDGGFQADFEGGRGLALGIEPPATLAPGATAQIGPDYLPLSDLAAPDLAAAGGLPEMAEIGPGYQPPPQMEVPDFAAAEEGAQGGPGYLPLSDLAAGGLGAAGELSEMPEVGLGYSPPAGLAGAGAAAPGKLAKTGTPITPLASLTGGASGPTAGDSGPAAGGAGLGAYDGGLGAYDGGFGDLGLDGGGLGDLGLDGGGLGDLGLDGGGLDDLSLDGGGLGDFDFGGGDLASTPSFPTPGAGDYFEAEPGGAYGRGLASAQAAGPPSVTQTFAPGSVVILGGGANEQGMLKSMEKMVTSEVADGGNGAPA